MTRHRWITISGVGPGVGKSTLGEGLARELRAKGLSVDLIPEEDLFVREEFVEAAAGFRDRRYESMSHDLLRAYDRLIQKAETESNTVIFDWEAAGMVEDLPWAEDQTELNRHVQAVADRVRVFEPVLLFLEASLRLAFDRAVAQRGDPWVTRYAALGEEEGLARDASPEERAFANVGSRQAWRRRTQTAYNAAGWPIIEIDATGPAEAVLVHALALVLGESLL